MDFMNIQVLPPKPPLSGLSFDLIQFNRKLRPTAARRDGDGIAYADYERMHTHRMTAGVHHRNDYSWAHNDATVREVLAAMLSKRLYVRIHPTLENIRFADKLFECQSERMMVKAHRHWEKFHARPKHPTNEEARSIFSARQAGGLSHFYLGILLRCTRQNLESTVVAEEMHCTPQNVRVMLARMHYMAKRLAAGTCRFPKRVLADEAAKQKHLAKYLPKKPAKQPVFIPNPTGLCVCGCGQMTERAKQTERFKGRVKGEFSMFRPGHVSRVRPGSGRPKNAAVAA